MRRILGRTVTVTVDRPLGSRHPRWPDMIYPVNYGYVTGITGGDGEAQDAYILGVDSPLETFEGRVIAVIHRLDDVEDKWVVAPEDRPFAAEEIEAAVAFQERYFCHELFMAM
ncbi:MAG: inorganic pyrophosphatase [Ruminococcaceae bacterium]|nr:inorganic pyrophosphatase [Oscillospiraceae bacterium]